MILNRYLGSKNELIPEILEAVKDNALPGATVGDLFSGTLSVSLALKENGYNVISNDINAFSATYARAYLVNSEIPFLDIRTLLGSKDRPRLLKNANKACEKLQHNPGFNFLSDSNLRDRFKSILTIIYFLESGDVSELPTEHSHSFIYDNYCEAGKDSAYVSSRGTAVRRRFFSPENAKKIDAMLNWIRFWKLNGLLNHPEIDILLSIIVRAVEKVSNTQGTYHDFPRNKYDPRALKPITLAPPAFDSMLVGGIHIAGNAEDSLTFVDHAPAMDVLYLDPPYNFRQYTSYYFLPNLLCRYPYIADLKIYFSNIQFVRGQNMDDDFSSTFCKKSAFIKDIHSLVEKAQCETIILSYFNGTNHWNKFKEDCNGDGYRAVCEFFESDTFQKDSFEVRPVERKNYQSYGGYKARQIDEYLFIAKKANSTCIGTAV